MYKKILVPLDGSQRAEAILPHVEELAASYGAEVILLRIFQVPYLTPVTDVSENEFEALPHLSREDLLAHVNEAHEYLRSVTDRLVGSKGIKVRYRIVSGPVAASIIRTAAEEEVDLIAMASHGSSGIKGVYYGSVAAGVLQRVDRPLLIVRAYDS
jgi:nucleotide-binding universal stress UspA family protein